MEKPDRTHSKSKIFLLGLPGSGKTTLGKELSASLHLPFVDLDLEIERESGKKIKEIFAGRGEDYFRQLESNALKKWCDSSHGFIMATGGGAPCFFDNMEQIRRAGISVFLDVPVKEIVERMKKTALSERPLLGKVREEGLRDQIELLRTERIRFYSQATLTLSGEKMSAEEIIKKLDR